MASFNFTLEDYSPLITYAPSEAWSDATNTEFLDYSAQSLHVTSTQNATATVKFFGTGISFFGGHRQEYGSFTFTVDGKEIGGGSANGAVSTKQVLATISQLENAEHTAVLTNSGGASIDIDFLAIEAQIGASQSQLTTTTIDDTDSSISYFPSPSDWTEVQGDLFIQGTIRNSQVAGARASINFFGDAVTLFGTVSPDNANLQVKLDGQATTVGCKGVGNVNADPHPSTVVFYANGFSPGNHTLEVEADPNNSSNGTLDLDAIMVYSSQQPNSDVPAASSSASVPPSTPVLAIVLGTIGGVAFLVLVGIGAFLFLGRRRRNARSRTSLEAPRVPSPVLPMQPPNMVLRPDPEPIQRPPPMARAFPRTSVATYQSNVPSYAAPIHSRDSSITSTTRILPSSSSQLSSGRAQVYAPSRYAAAGTARRGDLTFGPRRPNQRQPEPF